MTMKTKAHADAAPASCGQHTPGKWEVDLFENDEGQQEACVCGPSGYLFGVACTPGTSIDDTDIANLTLAAQAPDLLRERDQLRADKAELLAVLREIMKCNHALGAISRPIGNEARAVLAKHNSPAT